MIESLAGPSSLESSINAKFKCSSVNRIRGLPVDGCRLAGDGQQKRALGSATGFQQKSDGGTGSKPRSWGIASSRAFVSLPQRF